MRKRNIKTYFHWVIMTVILLFPLIMVILSGFGNNSILTMNQWCNDFISLDVNSWYQTLLNTIGIGVSENQVMFIMYVYPLYVIWVYVLDVLVDIFLVIVKIGHNALERLGVDND